MRVQLRKTSLSWLEYRIKSVLCSGKSDTYLTDEINVFYLRSLRLF